MDDEILDACREEGIQLKFRIDNIYVGYFISGTAYTDRTLIIVIIQQYIYRHSRHSAQFL